MIVESIVGGTVIALAAVGTCSTCRYLRQRLARWLSPVEANVSQRDATPKDPTPSFTVELVRTVLEHQARREDDSRQQMLLLMMQVATGRQGGHCSALPFCEPEDKRLPHHNGDAAAPVRDGMVSRTIRRLLPGRKR